MSDNNQAGRQGEFRGDFTRDTFDPHKHFSRVLKQQGRVQLDADWNEQTSILLHYLRTLAADLIGHHGGPGDGFLIESFQVMEGSSTKQDFSIKEGRYYVEGILCENEKKIAYSQHRGISFTDFQPLSQGNYLVYLDVWERHITFDEDEDREGNNPSIREVALGGPDTATRARIVWQVRVKPSNIAAPNAKNYETFLKELEEIIQPGTGQIKAKAQKSGPAEGDPCITSPEARYRGAENQLYRVEVHTPGTKDQATFKWSRDNSSVAFPILDLNPDGTTTTVTLAHLGRDDKLSLTMGDWVEIVDDDYVLQNRAEPLLQVNAIDRDTNEIKLTGAPATMVGQDAKKHPLLRRWDQRQTDKSKPTEWGMPITEGTPDWIELEDGVLIQFQPSSDPNIPNQYRTGDYWLIPARTETGDVEWPGPVGDPDPLPPHGIEHHYAPLAVIEVKAPDGNVKPTNTRRTISPVV